MTVADRGTVDIVAVDREGRRLLLILVDHLGSETDEGEHALLLKEKINAYFAYVETGQAATGHPGTERYEVVIEVKLLHPPGPLVQQLLTAAAVTAGKQSWKLTPTVVTEWPAKPLP